MLLVCKKKSDGRFRFTRVIQLSESHLWEGFVTEIYVDGFRAHLFPIMRSENQKLNGSGINHRAI